jgi:release factor glutamine methyltransferase
MRAMHASSEPEAYSLGWIPFLGLRIELGSRPLIPRPETEWWTEELITELAVRSKDQEYALLDLCAGSGAIGLAMLKELTNAAVSFGEIVPAHVEQITKNIAVNELDGSRARVRASDLFSAFSDEMFDIIAANPPYVPEGRVLDESVSKWEPPEALYAGEDGLDLIRKIAKEAPRYMKTGGQVWCEVDSPRAALARGLFLAGGASSAELRTDQYGRERLVVAHY